MHLIVYGLNHKTASLAVRECMSMSEENKREFFADVARLDTVDGAVVLSTCNRTEFYFSCGNYHASKNSIRNLIVRYSGYSYEEISRHLYFKKDADVVKHLFTVTTGLDSMVLGESQILGQVQEAYQEAKDLGMTNNLLNKLFQHAVMTSKLVRNNTFLDRRPVSVSTTAIDLAKRNMKDFRGSSALVIGAGKNSELAIKYLQAHGLSTIFIANRTLSRAEALAEKYRCKAVPMDEYPRWIKKVQLVVSSTSAPGIVVKEEDLKSCLDGRKEELLLLDLAVPRDVDPALARYQGVRIVDLDSINQEVEGNIKKRIIEAEKARVILHSEARKFMKWKESLAVVPVIVDLREKAEMIKERELEKAFRRLGEVTPRERHIIETMATTIVNTFLHSASENIKDIDVKDGMLSAYVLKRLFELDNLEISLDGSIFENEEQVAN